MKMLMNLKVILSCAQRAALATALLSVTVFVLPTAAQTDKQNATAPFTPTEVVQFFHTVQTQARSWKDTISSIEPSALHLKNQEKELIEQQKSSLLYELNEIGKLRPGGEEKNNAIDLGVEFWLFNDLCEVKDGVNQLSGTLADDPNGQIVAARLVEIYKEAQSAKDSLFREVMNRITALAVSVENKDGRAPKSGKR
jgi:hypothetical protein